MLGRALDVVFPRRCAGCAAGPWPFCDVCVASLLVIEPPWCERCGCPTDEPVLTCRGCPPQPLAWARGPFLFEGPARSAVHRLKFSGWRTVSEALADAMAELGPFPADAICWVPLARRRESERGYDQARALAQALAHRTDLPARPLLRRTRATAPQARRSAVERRAALEGAFVATGSPPARIVLVDDVLTTGATASACAEALVRAGARSVGLVTATRAIPGPGPLRYARRGFPSGSVVARGAVLR